MSMLMTTLMLPMLATVGQSAPKASPEMSEPCRSLEVRGADNPRPARPVEPLGRQPLGNQEKAVMHREGDCLKPIIVREDVGTRQR
jgi:hypothetical protein